MQRIPVPAALRAAHSDELSLTRASLAGYNPDSHCCQRCGKQVWVSRKTATYRRGVTYVKDGRRVDEDTLVPVYLCEKCGKSSRRGGTASGDYHHAILPDNLIPFTYYTLRFILTVLDDYARRTRTVAEICAHWDISVSTLYRWKKRYTRHYDAWARSMESIRHLRENSDDPVPEKAETEAIARSLERVSCSITHLVSGFFSRFRFSFLQPNRLTHFRPPDRNRRL